MTTSDEIFESAVRSTGDLAGVFEYDGDTCYFYLYLPRADTNKIRATIYVCNGCADLKAQDILIRWSEEEQMVGLFIQGVLWAAFDVGSSLGFGGKYSSGGRPSVPPQIAAVFVPPTT
jgi:hypothetical protein